MSDRATRVSGRVNSMTGFGEARERAKDVEVRVEMKSVNHRYLDLSCKLPSLYTPFEQEVERLVRARLERGRIEISVYRTTSGDNSFELVFRQDVFRQYLKVFNEGSRIAGVKPGEVLPLGVSQLLSRREIVEFVPAQASPLKEQPILLRAVKRALDNLVKMREREGAALKREVERHLGEVQQITRKIGGRLPEISKAMSERLRARIQKLEPDLKFDSQRIAQEVALLVDRADVTEELARLGSHFTQAKDFLRSGGAVGRKLEFLLQELGREVNTIGSKTQDQLTTKLVVDAKAALEKIREQVANIE